MSGGGGEVATVVGIFCWGGGGRAEVTKFVELFRHSSYCSILCHCSIFIAQDYLKW